MEIALAGGYGYLGKAIAKIQHPILQWGSRDWPERPPNFPHVLINLIRPRSPRAAVFSSLRLRRYGAPILLASSTAVYERPLSPYGWSKLLQEWLLVDRACIIRLPHLCGGIPPGDSVLDRWLSRQTETIRVYSPDRQIDFLHVDEAALWLLSAAALLPYVGRVTLSSESGPATLSRWASLAAAITGKPLFIEPHPDTTTFLPYSSIRIGDFQALWRILKER